MGENGVSLSRGEKQRLVIARALLRNPRILIMDEATASLDPEIEKQILPAILQYMKGRTVLYVTHRPALLKYADYAVQLERGSIVNQGAPENMDIYEIDSPAASHTEEPAAVGAGNGETPDSEDSDPGTYKFPFKASIIALAFLLGVMSGTGEALAQARRPAPKPTPKTAPAKAAPVKPAPAPELNTPAPEVEIQGSGGF
ncbi:MAG: ATP-binding cassette domain-containing protein, partial [Planctomycetota bacterium]